MDTADTGTDTGQEIEEEIEVTSAAALAGEEGGVSCSTSMANPSLILSFTLIVLLFIVRRA